MMYIIGCSGDAKLVRVALLTVWLWVIGCCGDVMLAMVCLSCCVCVVEGVVRVSSWSGCL